jgi:hypothetical protein
MKADQEPVRTVNHGQYQHQAVPEDAVTKAADKAECGRGKLIRAYPVEAYA